MSKISVSNSILEEVQGDLKSTLEKQRELFRELAEEMALFYDGFNDTDSPTLVSFIEDVERKNIWLLEEFNQLNTYMTEAISILNEADETISKERKRY